MNEVFPRRVSLGWLKHYLIRGNVWRDLNVCIVECRPVQKYRFRGRLVKEVAYNLHSTKYTPGHCLSNSCLTATLVH